MTDLGALAEALGAESAHHVETVQSLWRGYGEIFRARLVHGPADTVIVKHIEPPDLPQPWSAGHQRKLWSYKVEHAFYTQYAEKTQARIAAPLHLGENFFVLEDLDGAGFPGRTRHPDDDQIRLAIDWLATFHRGFLRAPPVDLWERGTYWNLATRDEELEAMAPGPLKNAAHDLDQALNADLQTLVHGDAKSANFCFGEGVAAVDFQYTGGGIGLQDVVYLLYGLDDQRLVRDHDRWIDHYFEKLDSPEAEASWRPLVDICWADFQRFLSGWAPGYVRSGSFSDQRTAAALHAL